MVEYKHIIVVVKEIILYNIRLYYITLYIYIHIYYYYYYIGVPRRPAEVVRGPQVRRRGLGDQGTATFLYIYIYVYIVIQTRTCVYVYVCVYTYIYIYIYTYMGVSSLFAQGHLCSEFIFAKGAATF